MVSSRLVRRTAVVVCAGGIAGMIVSSVLNHNGAAITFGLLTAAAVLCSMVATAVAADITRQLTTGGAARGIDAETELKGAPGAGRGPETGSAPPETGERLGPEPTDEDQAALVEALVETLVQSGTDEAAARELVRQSVRLGRILAAR
jgi:hypothetical protein